MKIKKYYMCLITATVFFSISFLSCYSDYGMSTSDFDIAVSLRDNNANFQKYRTYAMPDSVVRMTSNGGSSNTTYDKTILDEVEKQMTALGYTRVEPGPNTIPDLVILVGVTSSDNYTTSGGSWWGWWGWYPGWGYYPGIGGGWYPSYGYSYSYTTGTILITMIDPRESDPANKTLGVIWSGAINGILESSTVNNQNRIIDGINQLFAQSPYLRLYN